MREGRWRGGGNTYTSFFELPPGFNGWSSSLQCTDPWARHIEGRIFDSFSSGPGGDIAETVTSDGPGSSISAHGAWVGSVRAPPLRGHDVIVIVRN